MGDQPATAILFCARCAAQTTHTLPATAADAARCERCIVIDARAQEIKKENAAKAEIAEWQSLKLKLLAVPVIALVIGAVWFASKCSRDDGDTVVRGPSGTEAERIRASRFPDAGPPPDAQPAVNIPSTKLYAKTIIGKSRADVVRTFGEPASVNGDESAWLMGEVDVTVNFEKGKATWYSAKARRYVSYETMAAWAAADLPDPKSRYAVEEISDEGRVFYPQVWDAKALAKERKRTEKLLAELEKARSAQEPIVDLINLMMEQADAVYRAAVVDDELVISGSPCSGAVLEKLEEALQAGKMSVWKYFLGARCDDGGATLQK